MIAPNPNYTPAQLAAVSLLQEYGIFTPPVPVISLAMGKNLSVFNADLSSLPDVAGYLDPEENKIIVNKDDPVQDQAYSIAFELGFYLLHQADVIANPTDAVLYRNMIQKALNPAQQEAMSFAEELLVPQQFLSEFANYNENEIASIFGVSTETAQKRLVALGWRKAP